MAGWHEEIAPAGDGVTSQGPDVRPDAQAMAESRELALWSHGKRVVDRSHMAWSMQLLLSQPLNSLQSSLIPCCSAIRGGTKGASGCRWRCMPFVSPRWRRRVTVNGRAKAKVNYTAAPAVA